MATMTVSEARAALADIVERVLAGEEVTLTRHGEPVVVMLRPDALRVRRADGVFAGAARLRAQLEEARHRPLSPGGGLSAEYAEALVAEIRAERDGD